MVMQVEITDLKVHKNFNIKEYVPIAILLVGLALASFVASYGVGKSQGKSQTVETSESKNGNKLLKAASFSLEYPEDWEVVEHKESEPKGVKISYRGNQIEIWQDSPRQARFPDELKVKQKETKTSDIRIDDRTAKITEYFYNSGPIFSSVEIPADQNSPQVTFWSQSADADYQKIILEIVASYKD